MSVHVNCGFYLLVVLVRAVTSAGRAVDCGGRIGDGVMVTLT
jgi:hypothetical protein